MNCIEDKWTNEDMDNLLLLLNRYKNQESILWTKKIYNTQKDCFAVKIPILRQIAKTFGQNWLSFINNAPVSLIEVSLIKGILINKISDLELLKKCMFKYSKEADSWAETDIIKIKITKENYDYLLATAKEFLKAQEIFVRRLGVIILFNFIDKGICHIFNEIEKLHTEKEYYVNTAIAWLLCECFIKQRDNTYEFLEKHKLNTFVANKFYYKCKDSYRISDGDKRMLIKFKK